MFTRLDPATVESVMNINFFSPVRLTLALLPHMLERGTVESSTSRPWRPR